MRGFTSGLYELFHWSMCLFYHHSYYSVHVLFTSSVLYHIRKCQIPSHPEAPLVQGREGQYVKANNLKPVLINPELRSPWVIPAQVKFSVALSSRGLKFSPLCWILVPKAQLPSHTIILSNLVLSCHQPKTHRWASYQRAGRTSSSSSVPVLKALLQSSL